MAVVTLGDVMQVTLGYKTQGQQCLMVRHYYLANTPSDTDLDVQYETVTNNWLAGPVDVCQKLSILQHSDTFVNFIMAQIIYPTRRYYFRSVQNIPGTAPGVEPMPPNTAVTGTFQPEVPGRGRSGSIHLGGLTSQSYTDDGLVDPDYAAGVDELLAELRKGIDGVTPNNYWKPCIYSPTKSPRINPIVGHTVQPTMRVMRRRTVGLGI